ncbi:WYL domain-containing protein [Streptococcus parauberis]|uniref:helix-turn-helix transcriptional regulator n=1 Tax=Streptococcus parauberis TaxID=1348 RepID=UPI0028928EA4|nr:WYL domain-containing protein [Streptococcus parauberis]MDT2750339.1 WYL domain-containing protein [Streptococcus parauberis]
MEKYEINNKTFQRDIDKLRIYYTENCLGDIIYNRKRNCYQLNSKPDQLTKEEIFALCKIFIESRAFNKKEFMVIVEKLLKLATTDAFREINKAINNEKVNYIQLQHGKNLVHEIWELRQAITEQKVIQFGYERADHLRKEHEVKPVGIVFSEFYFYLLAFPVDKEVDYPTVYRVDRIIDFNVMEGTFRVPYENLFSESEFRKRTSFMYTGELQKVRFEYTGVLEALLDRLPTAIVEQQLEGVVVVSVESYGEGLSFWLNSQGKKVKRLGKF